MRSVSLRWRFIIASTAKCSHRQETQEQPVKQMSSCSKAVLKKKKKGGVIKSLKINGEALFKREKKDGTAAGASQMRFSLFYWLVYSIRRERQHIDTPVVCSAAHGATQTNPARSKHSYSSMRPVSVCVCVCTRARLCEVRSRGFRGLIRQLFS